MFVKDLKEVLFLCILQVKEEIVIVFNKRLSSKAKGQFTVDFVGTGGAVQVTAKQLNSSTLILETPGRNMEVLGIFSNISN